MTPKCNGNPKGYDSFDFSENSGGKAPKICCSVAWSLLGDHDGGTAGTLNKLSAELGECASVLAFFACSKGGGIFGWVLENDLAPKWEM